MNRTILASSSFVSLVLVAAMVLGPASTRAYVSQADGVLVPQTGRMQACLDRPGTGETMAGAVSALADAAVSPEAFRPVENPRGSGRYPVTFQVIGEGAGYRNSFGWFWIDEDPTVVANLRTVFDCRPGSSCSCPCNPDGLGRPMSSTVTIDFATVPGFRPGRAISFWIRTPERVDGSGGDPDNCGSAADAANRIYFTSRALNDDGDYVHYLVYRSATRTNTFYFGFEDLFRGGDNDFEDMLVRVEGLVPLCDPRPEACNGVDDDCDGAIDEDLTLPCSSVCGPGVRRCVGGSFGACSAPMPATEVCNALDDDCDGAVDEGLSRACSSACGAGSEVCRAGAWVDCTAPRPGLEVCNGVDDDCDGEIDEDLRRACASACGSGVEMCVLGTFTGCTAPAPMAESCNGLDDDCNGRVDDGLTRACRSACGDGVETCIAGEWVGCTAPAPGLEACNGADDDCDGEIDEDLVRPCSSACGPGTERCTAGRWSDCDAPTPQPERCNNVDDDCDGVIDDGNPEGGAACLPSEDGGWMPAGDEPGDPRCAPGRLVCVGGRLECRGATRPGRELCNCVDDDCDGEVDEDSETGLCPGGRCIACGCASPCIESEFGEACPPGRTCDRTLADPSRGIVGYCVPGRCAGVTCEGDQVCDPTTGSCVDLCTGVSCDAGFACLRGRCVEDNCYGRGCPPGQRCRAGLCEPDPCAAVACAPTQFCRDGACIDACPVRCPTGTVCRDGSCVDDPCDGRCAASERCVDGRCVRDTCSPPCGSGRVCRGGSCVDDPCADIRCPAGTRCVEGSCGIPGSEPPPPPPAATPRRGLATGGGGLSCAIASPSRPAPITLLGLACVLGLLALRGGRHGPRAVTSTRARPRHGLLTIATCLALLGSSTTGCSVDPYCFENCDPETRDAGTDAGDAARDADAAPEGCVPAGDEVCNGVDDDCNGVVDDGFDLQRDPRHCGACDRPCVLPNAFPACEAGECVIASCEVGFHDLRNGAADGCEYPCVPSGAEICDEVDNDCNGQVDEGFDLATNLEHCGRCGQFCAFPNATARCEAGRCVLGECRAGFLDLDGNPETGCEYACTPMGAERCNGVDDDCDGDVDEGYDLSSDPEHCGRCNQRCAFARAVGRCTDGVCGLAGCEDGFVDLDGNPLTGCEYACVPAGDVDACNGRDDDCDGDRDDEDPAAGMPCGRAIGECRPGVTVCQLGALVCVGDREPTPEVCNGRDDDCNGAVDDGPMPGVGVRCGETDEGACEYGTTQCVAGSIRCGGTYVGATAELCNGVDDDCDGAVDDSPMPPGSTPPSCALTRGVCAGRAPSCTGAGGWQCAFPPTYQPTETICDGLDNDCDGSTDEGCLRVLPPTGDVRVDLGDAEGASHSTNPVVSGNAGSIVYAAWMDLRGGGRAHVLFNRSTDGGNAFGATPILLDGANGPAIGPRFGVTGSSRHLVTTVWADFRGGSSYREIFRRHSADSGASWGSADLRLNPGQNLDSFGVDVAVSGSNVVAVYETFTTTRSRHIFCVRSADGGATWAGPVQVDRGTGATFVAAAPRVAMVGSRVYVTWRDNRSGALDVRFNRSTDGGATFGMSDVRLDVGTAPGASSSFAPVIAAEGSNVYVAWVDDRNGGTFDIYLNRSSDSGATWLSADAIRIDRDPLPHDSIEPRIVTTVPGAAVVAWLDYRDGLPDVYASRTTDAGGTWSTPARLDTGSMAGRAGSYELVLGAAGELVAAAWSDDRSGLLDIYANYSLDGGATWQPSDVRLDSTAMPGSSDSQDPDLYVAPGAVHVVWVDHRGGPNGDIRYRRLQ
ncbi:MAG: MopE-related protein [Myxococcales bacterium]|nr:MopE-related protein [Myxococcales bacterium]